MPGITGFVRDCQDWTSFDSRVAKARSSMAEVAMRTWDQLALGRTTALRRQPSPQREGWGQQRLHGIV